MYSMINLLNKVLVLCVFLLIFLLSIKHVEAEDDVVVVVGRVYDDYVNASHCTTPYPSTSCSLRSAWELCHVSDHMSCTITLPAASIMIMNSTFGELTLQNNKSIAILGNGATLVGSDGMNALFYGQNETTIPLSLIPTVNIDGVIFQGFGSIGENGGKLQGGYWKRISRTLLLIY